MFQIKVVEKVKTDILCSVTFFFLPKIMLCMRCGKIWYSQTGSRWRYNTAHALGMPDNLGYRHTLTLNMQYLLLFHSSDGYANAPQYYIICICLFLHPHMARQSTMYFSLDFIFWSPPSPFLLLFSFIFLPFLISLPFLHLFSSPFPVCDFTSQHLFPHSDLGSPPTSTHSSPGLGQPLLPLFAPPPPSESIFIFLLIFIM